MPAGENQIKQKIVLEGEKEYSSAIRDANRNLKTLRSELKAETAELGKNATEQQKNEAKAKSLQKQIKEQEKVVKACRDALEEVREKYGDNEDAMAKYEQKLNAARATLANMRSSLEDVGDAFQDVGQEAGQSLVETRSFAEAFQSLGSAADTVSTAISGIFSTMVGTIKEAINLVWGDITELAARSNSWIDLAGFWNTSATEIQKWAHAAGYASAQLSDINDVVTKINAADPKKITELVGISDVNFEDDWKYATAVMDAMSRMDHEARNNAAFEIFGGRQATKAMDLLNDWQTIVDHLEQFDVTKGGVGMSAEDIQTMSNIGDMVNGINQTWNAFKDSVIAGVTGELTLNLGSNVQGVLDALIAFVNADSQEERDQALQDMETNLTEFFTKLGEAITAAAKALDDVGTELQGSENGVLRLIGNVLTTLSDVLEWFTVQNNIDKVVAGFEALAAVWAGSKMISAVSTLASLAANITLIKNGGGFIGALLGIGKGKGSAAKTDTTATTARQPIVVDNPGSGKNAKTGTKPGDTSLLTQTGGLWSIGTAIADFFTSTKGILSTAALLVPPMVDRLKDLDWAKFLAASKNDVESLPSSVAGVATATKEQNQRSLKTLWDVLRGEDGAGTRKEDAIPVEIADGGGGGMSSLELPEKPKVPGLTQEAKEGWQRFLDECAKEWPETGIPGLTKEAEEGWSLFTANLAQETEQALTDITEEAEPAGLQLTEAQREAAEAFWDEWRENPDDFSDEAWDAFEGAFEGMEELFDQLNDLMDDYVTRNNENDEWRDMNDIPQEIWGDLSGIGQAGGSLDSAASTMKGLPAQILAAVRAGVSNIVVSIDGYTAGQLLAPFISEQIARDIG